MAENTKVDIEIDEYIEELLKTELPNASEETKKLMRSYLRGYYQSIKDSIAMHNEKVLAKKSGL